MFSTVLFGLCAVLIVSILCILAYEIITESYDKCYDRMEKEGCAHNGNCRGLGLGRECQSCPYYTELPIMKIDEEEEQR